MDENAENQENENIDDIKRQETVDIKRGLQITFHHELVENLTEEARTNFKDEGNKLLRGVLVASTNIAKDTASQENYFTQKTETKHIYQGFQAAIAGRRKKETGKVQTLRGVRAVLLTMIGLFGGYIVSEPYAAIGLAICSILFGLTYPLEKNIS